MTIHPQSNRRDSETTCRVNHRELAGVPQGGGKHILEEMPLNLGFKRPSRRQLVYKASGGGGNVEHFTHPDGTSRCLMLGLLEEEYVISCD